MMQLSFATLEHRNKKKHTKRERFLSDAQVFTLLALANLFLARR